MRYDAFKYLYPPRPETAVPPSALDEVERRGWWAQPKFNGTNCLLFFTPIDDRKRRGVIQRGRHGDSAIKSWSPGENWQRFAQRLPEGWCVLQGELLHTKGTGRDTVWLHDALVFDSHYLVGAAYAARYALLNSVCGSVEQVEQGIMLAPILDHGFRSHWERLRGQLGIEGLVAKDPEARLQLCCRASANASWQVKCRYPTANLSF